MSMKKSKKKKTPRLRSEKDYFAVINIINKQAYIYWKCPGVKKYEEELRSMAQEIMKTGAQIPDEMKLRLKYCRSII